jgi:hypothetical protein
MTTLSRLKYSSWFLQSRNLGGMGLRLSAALGLTMATSELDIPSSGGLLEELPMLPATNDPVELERRRYLFWLSFLNDR